MKVSLLALRVLQLLHAVQHILEKYKLAGVGINHEVIKCVCTVCKHAVQMSDRLYIGLQVHSRYQRHTKRRVNF